MVYFSRMPAPITKDITSTFRASWKNLSRFPGGKLLASKALGFLAPYSGSILPEILELRSGFAKVAMKDRRRVRNHLNSIHAIALANLGEMTSGLALMLTLPESPNRSSQMIIRNLMIDYTKKARGTITAECTIEQMGFSHEDEAAQDGVDEVVETLLKNQKGEIVATTTTIWRVRSIVSPKEV